MVPGWLLDGHESCPGARDRLIILRTRAKSGGLVGLTLRSFSFAVSSSLGRSIGRGGRGDLVRSWRTWEGSLSRKMQQSKVLLPNELSGCCYVFLQLWVGVVVVGGAGC